VPPRRRVDPADGAAALAAWVAAPEGAPSDVLATAVRFTLDELSTRHPGRSVEVRVPPYGATQCLPGVGHTRGTPPNVVETDPATWLGLAVGQVDWPTALADGKLQATGSRADLSGVLPLR